MERIEIAKEINKLKRQYDGLMRGRLVPTPRAMAIHKRIVELQEEIQALDKAAAKRLALEKAPVDEVLEVIAIPLLADVMNDIVSGVNAMLRRHGVQETVFGIYTAQIHKAALAIVDSLDHADANLPRLLDVDDTLVDAVKKKLMSFIKQRLSIKK